MREKTREVLSIACRKRNNSKNKRVNRCSLVGFLIIFGQINGIFILMFERIL